METAQDLRKIANELRGEVLRMVWTAGAGHVAGPLSSAEVVAYLYFGGGARIEPKTPWSEERDLVVLSCGHYVPILYAALARAGYFPREELSTFMKLGSRLPGHPEYRSVPGVEVSAGSLGQGASQAVGMALALKIKYGERPQEEMPRVWCIISDGELQEGQVWEAFGFAVRRQLDNLIFVVDRNRIQIENYTSQVVTGSPAGKLEAFGLYTLEVEGHDIDKIRQAGELAKHTRGAPAVLVAETIAGKGVSLMERKPEWHDRVPTEDELKRALKELNMYE